MRFYVPAFLTLFCLLTIGCDEAAVGPDPSADSAVDDTLQGTASGTGTFYSVDGSVKIECPSDWEIVDLNDDADIEVGNDREELYVLVMSLPKIDYAGTREEYSADTRGFLVEGTDNPVQEKTDKTTINGFPAEQYTIRTTIDRTNYMYLHTIIETDEKYHQVLTWSYPSKFKKEEALLNQITESIRDVLPEQ